MTIKLRPEIERYVQQQISSGRYASVEAVLEDAVSPLMHEEALPEEIDDETHAALERSEEQIRRGEVFTLGEVREHFLKRGVELRPQSVTSASSNRPGFSWRSPCLSG